MSTRLQSAGVRGSRRTRGRSTAGSRRFVDEREAYALIAKCGLRPPLHAPPGANGRFSKGERVVVKGLGEGLWHKSELGAVRSMAFDRGRVARETAAMRARIAKAGHRWRGAMVCEHIKIARSRDLPAEFLVSLVRTEAGWIAVLGAGGLAADLLGGHMPPLCWPVDAVTPAMALSELEEHDLGRVVLGRVRGSQAVTSPEGLEALITALWRLVPLAEDDGVTLLEMNPVAFDASGEARPLDAVGLREKRPPRRMPPPSDFIQCLIAPSRVVVAGVSVRPGGVGHIVLDNLLRCPSLAGRISILKPGADSLMGIPCVHTVAALKDNPADLLLLATPAAASVDIVEKLVGQGGGARVVGVIAGGIGDGADRQGLGERLVSCITAARRRRRWTPAILGPNSMGHWVPGRGLDTTFIPRERLPDACENGGSLVLLSQSGAFLLSRRSKHPGIDLFLGAAIGNQVDVALPDFLGALAPVAECGAVAAYVESFGPGHVAATAAAARRLAVRGVNVLIHRAGRTAAGRVAAASHTGALLSGRADRRDIEGSILARAGVRFSDTVADFDAALQWLAAFPSIRPGTVALVSNAGFECVTAIDALPAAPARETGFSAATLQDAEVVMLERMLAAEGLTGLVNPRLPLDLTPMASETVFLKAAEILVHGSPGILIMGLVPFTPRLRTGTEVSLFAMALASLSQTSGKPIGIAIDAGANFGSFRSAFVDQRLPVFDRMEDAVRGLRTLA